MSKSVIDMEDFELFLEMFLSDIELLNLFERNWDFAGVNADP